MEAVIFVGVQGAGKTTFYRDRFLHSHVRLSLDLLRTRNKLSQFLSLCLATQQRFVIDNTNPTRLERAPYIEAARARRFEVTGYYFDAELGEAIDRNSQRSGKHFIPVKGVVSTFRKIEQPDYAEGFHRLYVVKAGMRGEWTVTPAEPSTTL